MKRAASILAVIALWAALPAGALGDAPTLEYEPSAGVVRDYGAAASAALVQLRLRSDEVDVERYPYPHMVSSRRPAVRLTWRHDALRIAYEGAADAAAPGRIEYSTMRRIGVVADYGWRGVSLGGEWFLWCRSTSTQRRAACARALADYLYVEKWRHDFRQTSDQRFQEVLAKYRDRSVRPAFPEDARRHRVMAEQAVQQKRLTEAVNSYVMAVRAAPWWPDGYYNLALLNAELKNYEESVRMMKRYLALEPDAPDARAAQDQVYRWEGMLAADGK